MNLSNSALIQTVYPGRYSKDNSLSIVPRVVFLRDIDSTTLSDSTVLLEKVGVSGRVTVVLSYSNKTLTITPAANLVPQTTYRVTIVGDAIIDDLTITGIKDILGNGMRGDYLWEFTTGSSGTLAAPTLTAPDNQSAIQTQPTFTWGAIVGADHYDIQVALNSTFENIYWPLGSDIWDPNATSITPSRAFEDTTEYFWRVRGVDADGNPGVWATFYSFYKGDPTAALVSPEDAPVVDFVSTTVSSIQLYKVFPGAEASNIPFTLIPYVEIQIKGQVDLDSVTTETFGVTGFATNLAPNETPSYPQWVPSLNGSEYNYMSGGVAYSHPVDEYIKITASGMLVGTIVGAYDEVGDITSFKLTPTSDSYFKVNNRYICVFDHPNLSLKWWFTTQYDPLYSTTQYVRSDLRGYVTEYTDDEINFKIWDHSILALYLSKYPPTYRDAGSWYGINSIGVNALDPPYYVKQFVRFKTAYEIMRSQYAGMASGLGRKRLADLELEQSSIAEDMKIVLGELRRELDFWDKKVKGLTLLGQAKPRYAVRSKGFEVSRNWGYPLRDRGTF